MEQNKDNELNLPSGFCTMSHLPTVARLICVLLYERPDELWWANRLARELGVGNDTAGHAIQTLAALFMIDLKWVGRSRTQQPPVRAITLFGKWAPPGQGSSSSPSSCL